MREDEVNWLWLAFGNFVKASAVDLTLLPHKISTLQPDQLMSDRSIGV